MRIKTGAIMGALAVLLIAGNVARAISIEAEKDPPNQTNFELIDVQTLPPGSGHLGLDGGELTEQANGLGSYRLRVSVLDVPTSGPIQISLDKLLLNNTGTRWTDMEIEIAEYPAAPDFLGTDPIFLASTTDSSAPGIGFTSITVDPQVVLFEDGPGVALGDIWEGWLGLEIPGPNSIGTGPDGVDEFVFLVTQTPSFSTVPEPSSLILAGGLAAALMSLCRQRSSKRAA